MMCIKKIKCVVLACLLVLGLTLSGCADDQKEAGSASNSSTVTGEKGEKGDKGEQGEQGIQGEKGDKGDQGEQGEQGIQGEKGEKGDQGEQGEQGIQGEKGEKGDQGEQGEQGIQGDKGDKGDQGVGVKSAYINEEGHLIVVLTDGTEVDAGAVTSPVEKYTVVFQDWNGTELLTVSNVTSGSSVTPPDDPEREGYLFAGWDTETDCVEDNLTVTALYDKVYDNVIGIGEPEIDPLTNLMTLKFSFAQTPEDPVPVVGFQLKIRYSENFTVSSKTDGNGVSSSVHADDHYISVIYFNLTGTVVSESFTYLTVTFNIADCQAGDRIYVDMQSVMNESGADITNRIIVDAEYIYAE